MEPDPHAIAALPRPQAVVFDWDNTLVDTWPCIHLALTQTLEAMGQTPWSFEETKARVGRSMREAFPQVFGDRWLEAKEVFFRSFQAVHLDMLAVAPGAPALLADLAARGLPMAVVSNKTGGFLRTEAEALGWTRHFHALVGAGDAPRDKPAADPVHLALAGTGIAAGPEVWMVGDSWVDVGCARAAGCQPILIGPPPALPPETGGAEEEGPDLTDVPRLADCAAVGAALADRLSHTARSAGPWPAPTPAPSTRETA